MGQKSFDVNASHLVIHIGDEAVIVATNIKNRKTVGDICAVKQFSQFVKVGNSSGANSDDPVCERSLCVWVCGDGLMKTFFGDDPHIKNLGQYFLNVNSFLLELVIRVADAIKEALGVLGIDAPEEM